MQFIGMVENRDPATFAPHAAEEQTVLAQLRAEGVITRIFRRVDGAGLVAILEAPSLDDLHRELDRLPLTRLGLVGWTFVEVAEL